MKNYKEEMNRPWGLHLTVNNTPLHLIRKPVTTPELDPDGDGTVYTVALIMGPFGCAPYALVTDCREAAVARLYVVDRSTIQLRSGDGRVVPSAGWAEVETDSVPAAVWTSDWWYK